MYEEPSDENHEFLTLAVPRPRTLRFKQHTSHDFILLSFVQTCAVGLRTADSKETSWTWCHATTSISQYHNQFRIVVTKSRPYLRTYSGSTHFGGQPGAGQRRSSLKPPCPSVEFGREYGVRKRVASGHGGRRRITLYILREECRRTRMANDKNPFSYMKLKVSSTMLFLH